MTLEQHKKLGMLIKEAMGILYIARHAYGRIPRKGIGTKLKHSVQALDKARCALDDILAAEFPDISDQEFFAVYYRSNNPNEFSDAPVARGILRRQPGSV